MERVGSKFIILKEQSIVNIIIIYINLAKTLNLISDFYSKKQPVAKLFILDTI